MYSITIHTQSRDYFVSRINELTKSAWVTKKIKDNLLRNLDGVPPKGSYNYSYHPYDTIDGFKINFYCSEGNYHLDIKKTSVTQTS